MDESEIEERDGGTSNESSLWAAWPFETEEAISVRFLDGIQFRSSSFFHPSGHMRLSSLSPRFLSATLVDALRLLGVVSDADLFFSATPLEIWRKLPPHLITFSEFERCVRAVMLRCAVPGSVATEVEERPLSVRSKPESSSGINVLDNLLGATLRDSVVEISGRHGVAATVRPLSLTRHWSQFPTRIRKTLALQIACNQLSLCSKITVLWIDTTGDFSPARAATVLRSTEPHEVRFPNGMPGRRQY